jgi:SAM-dependent methyltransferase
MSTDQIAFDVFANSYDEALSQGISISGEDKDFFAEGRIRWLLRYLDDSKMESLAVMDFGCGTGSATPHIINFLNPHSVTGVDVSTASLIQATNNHGSESASFLLLNEYLPNETIDLAYCNGVFHHIPREDRLASIDYVYRSLKPGGLFSFWENNPLNPGTRFVMSRCPFDKDAIPLTSFHAKRLLEKCGFKILRIDFLFIFPRVLRHLRVLEPLLSRFPLGAQYQILCTK